MTIVIAILAGLVGVLVGGVINILADDLPERDNPGPPHYPDGTPRPVSAWLGITAFLTGQWRSPNADAAADEIAVPDESTEPAGFAAPDESTGSGESAESSAPDKFTESGESAESAESEMLDPDDLPRRPPRKTLGWRHPVVEIGTGLAFAGLVLGFPNEPNLWAWLVYTAIMMLITVIDMEHRLILFVVIVPSCIFALVVAAISPPDDKPFSEFLIGGGVGFALFFAMFLGGIVFAMSAGFEGVAFGFGDVMLAILGGFMIGWKAFIFAALITVFVGAAGSILYMIGREFSAQRRRLFTPLPYGPYIVLGIMIMLLFNEQVQDFLIKSAY